MSTLRALAISLCRANSEPLSVVMVNMALRFLYGASIEKTAFATSSAFLPLGSFRIRVISVFFSTRVTIAPWLFGPTIRSSSQSPKRSPLASLGLSSMKTLSLIGPAFFPTARFRCFRHWRQCL